MKSTLGISTSKKYLSRASLDSSNQQLKRLKQLNELILSTVGDGIFGLDRDGNVIFINPSALELLGFTHQEIIRKHMHTMTHSRYPDGQEYPREKCPIYEAIHTGKVTTGGDEWFIKKDNSFLPVQFTSTPLREEGKITGAVISFADRTARLQKEKELQALNEELKRSNKELQDFASVASHDLQEPLRKIQAFSDRLLTKDQQSLTEGSIDYLIRINKAAKRMQTLINDLLTYARVTTKAQPFEVVDLNEILKNVLVDLEIPIENNDAIINSEPLPKIHADPIQMHQLFQNILGNALKFRKTSINPVISISTSLFHEKALAERKQRMFSIYFSDNGIGFDEKYLDKIFNVFQRLHTSREYGGNGVGLAVCKKIMERHNGTLTAQGTLEFGSTFILNFPYSALADFHKHRNGDTSSSKNPNIKKYTYKEVVRFE